jgi:predicted nuclease of predicted toxin-antitoxin system
LTLVLLDTNSYLRLAKRIRPLLGVEFGQKNYVVTIHKIVEDEVHQSPRLQFLFPWFDEQEFAAERLAKRIPLKSDEKENVLIVQSVLHGTVLGNVNAYTVGGRSPPGTTDCWLLALSQVKKAIVVTDDLGMHTLAREFGIPVWHGFELLDKLLTAKKIENELVREIYLKLEENQDLTQSWRDAKHTRFMKIFGKQKP